jgi:glutamyl-tRNA synthetase
MDSKELANLIFPDVKGWEYYEEKYPARDLPEGAIVTRFAPSPTGFVHIGSLYQALVAWKVARQTKGVFFLRVEDTDQKREIENGVTEITRSLADFGIIPTEGMRDDVNEEGNYGPYKQSLRRDIYQSFAKKLLEEGKAYPDFCTPEELDKIRSDQELSKERTGYYGKWAKYRDMPIDMAAEKIKAGERYIVRLKSPGDPEKKIKFKDIIKGTVEMPENDVDEVIIKGDGLPTYHFAHAVDDHLMHTTTVIRSDEWLPSVPKHIQLFVALGYEPPKYAHISPIMKNDNGNKRKLSKRKDPEAAVSYYHELGIPKDAVKEYLLNIANSNFEQWRKQNPDSSIDEFDLELNKMSVSGALFDMVKLQDVSKGVISKMTAEQVYEEALDWAEQYDGELMEMLENNREYSLKVLGIERGGVKPRKDIAKWQDLKDAICYMYDDMFTYSSHDEYQKINDEAQVNEIVKTYLDNYYDESDDKETWFNKVKDLADSFGYCKEVKEYKANPDSFKGHVGDVSTAIRIRLTGRSQTPDLYEIMKVIGKERLLKRI